MLRQNTARVCKKSCEASEVGHSAELSIEAVFHSQKELEVIERKGKSGTVLWSEWGTSSNFQLHVYGVVPFMVYP